MPVFVGSQSSTYVASSPQHYVIAGDIIGTDLTGMEILNGAQVTVLGRISTDAPGWYGIEMYSSSATLMIGQGAYVGGSHVGIYSYTETARIVNHGLVASQSTAFSALYAAIGGYGTLELDNYGIISGGVDESHAAAIRQLGATADQVTNSGTIRGDVSLGGGNDTFRQKAGIVDGIVHGGAGDDAYHIEAGTLDLYEADNNGYDQVWSAVDFTLPENVETLWLTGSADINGFGNSGLNTLIGNAGDNVLAGRGGNDFFAASEGEDALRGGAGSDQISFGADMFDGGVTFSLESRQAQLLDAATGTSVRAYGIEMILGSNGNDDFTGNAAANDLAGHDGRDKLRGAGGADTFYAGLGNDSLWGGAGADLFLYDSAAQANGDMIGDFVHGADKIDLGAIDANDGSGGNDAFTFIGGKGFTGVAGQLHYIAAKGWLEGDTDGDKAADFRIILDGAPDLTAADFVL